jgi:hypothetical protein
MSALLAAVSKDDLERVKRLVAEGADVKERDLIGFTPFLHVQASFLGLIPFLHALAADRGRLERG